MVSSTEIAEDLLGGIVFAIELVTFTLFFFEEGMVNLLRTYKKPMRLRQKGKLLVLDANNFDAMFGHVLSYLDRYGLIAVYSYKAFSTFFFMCVMWRSYSQYIRTGERGEFDMRDILNKHIITYEKDSWDLYMDKVWDGRVRKK